MAVPIVTHAAPTTIEPDFRRPSQPVGCRAKTGQTKRAQTFPSCLSLCVSAVSLSVKIPPSSTR